MTKQTRNRIILKFEDVADKIVGLKSEDKKIVLTQGSFDMVHIGHARYCQEAKTHGDVLIVGVDSDEKVRKRKGPDRPIVPEQERLEMLTYLRSVDFVVLKPLKAEKYALIKAVRPDVLVVTKEIYAKYSQDHLDELEKYCGKVVVLEPMATTSTSAKIRLVQIGAAHRISHKLRNTLVDAIEQVLEEYKE
jgi:D-glycero-beta-D-manno-heptose 1-phosphate adenylyltransferase